MSLPIGTCVRINSELGFLDGRTGVVTETREFWAEMGWSQVDLDSAPIRTNTFPGDELTVIGATERDGCGQGELFGGAP